jgi:hypothetical protein
MGAVVCLVLAGCCIGGPLGGLGVFLVLMAVGFVFQGGQSNDRE